MALTWHPSLSPVATSGLRNWFIQWGTEHSPVHSDETERGSRVLSQERRHCLGKNMMSWQVYILIAAGVLTGCADAARLRPKGGRSRSLVASDNEDVQQSQRFIEARVVEARVSAALREGSTVAAALALSGCVNDSAYNVTNFTDVIQTPQRLLSRTIAWVRKNNPGLWMLVASAMIQQGSGKCSELAQDARGQVCAHASYAWRHAALTPCS